VRLIQTYQTLGGREPFTIWLTGLDMRAQARINAYIIRVAQGGSRQNIEPVGHGVFEIKINFGPGYRVYFGQLGLTMILLLLGGNKRSQNRDIEQAVELWRMYCAENEHI
jgi:putative addiction module killer protein